ncbi:MAG TPA: response regulator [Elusimicrobiota bacterium]|nr:response regulator [Elusimicrobiota bacterium]
MRSARILVVDDEPAAVEMLARFLENAGHRVEGARSAEDAVEALKNGSFDLVLLDLILPGMTGLQALAELKTLTRAPIHVMTGLNDSDTRKDVLLLGASGFFGKPLDLTAVLAAVDALPSPA